MKRCAAWFFLLCFLTGCSGPPDEMETGMALRSKLLQASACSFEATITADYGNKIHTFSMDCKSDKNGDLAFTVMKPDSISGISGVITGQGGEIAFDDIALLFPLIAEEQLAPISAPWILLKTLRSGYMASACMEDEKIRLSVDDSFANDPLRLDIWLNSEHLPYQADILYKGRRILSVAVQHFQLL